MSQPTQTWSDVLTGEKDKPYFKSLLSFVENERASGKKIYPLNNEVFSALQLTPFSEVKIVILGQDPYHQPGQAHGLSFSVKPSIQIPPSLRNIYKELSDDIGFKIPNSGFLSNWASQGVLLLNAVLTVEDSKPGSHAGKGWETFTDRVVNELASKRENLVFLLWGSHALKKAETVDAKKHLVLKAPHPSPLSAHRGFLGCKHFSKANLYLSQNGITPVNWEI